MAFTPNSFYSGDLASINQGRTAAAAVDAADQASFRNFLASIAQDRTRGQLGNADIASRSQLGNRELDVRDRLGTGDIDLRRFLGTGDLNAKAADTVARRDVGMGQIASNNEATKSQAAVAYAQIAGQLEQVKEQGRQMQEYLRNGGGVNPTIQRAMMQNEQQQRELLAQAQAAATIANADLPTAINNLDQPWTFDTQTSRRSFFNTDPTARATVVGGILRNAGPQAGSIEFDPATGSFIPNRTLFSAGAPAVAAPRMFTPGVESTGIAPELLAPGQSRRFPITPEAFRQWSGQRR